MIIHFRDTKETYIERIEPLSDSDYWRLWVKRFGNLKGSPHSSISRKP